jgi:ABC-type phosphate/phosphonate transport system ATPase subunit
MPMKRSGLPEIRRDVGSVKGTFEISVKFMQNSTWQGQIHWVEKNQKQNFRSALEMLKLMDEALNEGAEDAV